MLVLEEGASRLSSQVHRGERTKEGGCIGCRLGAGYVEEHHVVVVGSLVGGRKLFAVGFAAAYVEIEGASSLDETPCTGLPIFRSRGGSWGILLAEGGRLCLLSAWCNEVSSRLEPAR